MESSFLRGGEREKIRVFQLTLCHLQYLITQIQREKVEKITSGSVGWIWEAGGGGGGGSLT